MDTILGLRANRRAFNACQMNRHSFSVDVWPRTGRVGYGKATWMGKHPGLRSHRKTSALYRIVVTPRKLTQGVNIK